MIKLYCSCSCSVFNVSLLVVVFVISVSTSNLGIAAICQGARGMRKMHKTSTATP